MRMLIVSTFLSLDGVMQAPGGPGEDFTPGGWSVNYWDEQMGQVMGEAVSRPFAMVLGRRTYDIMAAHWPHASEEAGANVFNEVTKYVASRSRPTLGWSNSVLIEGDAAEGIAALKKEEGPELQVHGSGNLIQRSRAAPGAVTRRPACTATLPRVAAAGGLRHQFDRPAERDRRRDCVI